MRHGIACVGQLQHFQIIVLISECDTILWIHAKGRYDIGKGRTFIGIRCNEINPDIPGGYDLDPIDRNVLENRREDVFRFHQNHILRF